MIKNSLATSTQSLDKTVKNQQDPINRTESKHAEVKEKLQIETEKVSISYSTESTVTYNSSMSLEETKADGFDLLRGLVLNIFKEQGIDYTIPTADGEINLNEISQEEAQDVTADDGYFGVEQTSDRIVELAIGIAGGDPSRLEAIKEGVDNGFQEALDAFGGSLPDISYDTYDAVMEKLDIWAGIDASQES